MKKHFYALLLRVLDLDTDYRGKKRISLGISPYTRRSPLLMLVLNFQELARFLMQPKFIKKSRLTTEVLRNSRKDKSALVVGNGPSARKLDFERVNSDNPDVWVVNNFYKIDPESKLNITHYVLSDPEYFKSDVDGNNDLLPGVMKYIAGKSITLVIPHWALGNKLIDKFNSKEVIFFDDRELSAWSKNISPTKPRGYIGLTLYKALGFALHLGYHKIYIIGMDNSELFKYTSDGANSLLLQGNHAYKENKAKVDLSDHYLDGLAGALTHYSHAFGDLLKFKGPIVNLDVESLTTAFPKVGSHSWVSVNN
jgi:hypothetical protein